MRAAAFVEQCFRDPRDGQQTLFAASGGPWDAFRPEEVEAALLAYLKARCRFQVMACQPEAGVGPDLMFLGGDRGILAYARIRYAEGDTFRPGDLRMPLEETCRMVQVAYSRLDRPVFLIWVLRYRELCGVFFETDEQIRDRLFRDPGCRQGGWYVPDLSQMGDGENLREIWNTLKKHNVRQY